MLGNRNYNIVPSAENIANMKTMSQWLRDNKAFITLNMGDYSDNRDEEGENSIPPDFSPRTHCDTPACVIGWATVTFPRPILRHWDGEIPDYGDFAMEIFGQKDSQTYGAFLFGVLWSNSVDEAIARLDYVIEHGDAPSFWSYGDEYTPTKETS